MDDVSTETSAGAPVGVDGPSAAPQPNGLSRSAGADGEGEATPRRRRWVLPALLAPVVVAVVIVIAWAVDTSGGGVARNVKLAGVDIGGLAEDELAGPVGELASELSELPVELVVKNGATYTTTAREIGLMLDEAETTSSALDVGDSAFLPARPAAWVRSLLGESETPLRFQVNIEQVAATVVKLEGRDRTPPTEPKVEVVDGAFHVIPGVDGRGLDPAEVARRLPAATQSAFIDGTRVIRLSLAAGPIPPLGTDQSAREAASEADAFVGTEPVEVRTAAGARTFSSDQLRSWIRLVSEPDGRVVLTMDEAAAAADLRQAFADVEGHPTDASFTLVDGVPVIVPGLPGKVCCADGAAGAILRAVRAGTPSIDLALVDGPPSFTVADAEAYGIVQAVGGNHAWRNGAPTTAAPGFTTYHAAGGSRVVNIHRIADLVRGAVVAPGASFSINDFVGKRTVANGFVEAGAIANGEHVSEIGGGISQFATTTFNAVYFAGLDINTYQAHSEYLDRYPYGREATMGFPGPDLKFTNNTPFGIMIWTSYTDTSLTVTLYSTPYATAEQTAIGEGTAGRCTTVTTTRTITYPDGHTEQDKFRARYRPPGSTTC